MHMAPPVEKRIGSLCMANTSQQVSLTLTLDIFPRHQGLCSRILCRNRMACRYIVT
ncbi:hypothetical protein ANANG_G00246140 [Anguilla anguilla]|uniref:Uncharacterized protein n=1 Tax=Anguilla anguilla TaxID=7936 RepID=A0A9D3LVL4_ANGAN|nr:hypothetical protein ANANG_G00246140 [Anguilla anguilla]